MVFIIVYCTAISSKFPPTTIINLSLSYILPDRGGVQRLSIINYPTTIINYLTSFQIAEVSKGSKFAEEIKEEQEERKREEEVNFVKFLEVL